MEQVLEFLGNNYIWFLIIALILFFALIGFIADAKRKNNKVEPIEEIEDTTEPTIISESIIEPLAEENLINPLEEESNDFSSEILEKENIEKYDMDESIVDKIDNEQQNEFDSDQLVDEHDDDFETPSFDEHDDDDFETPSFDEHDDDVFETPSFDEPKEVESLGYFEEPLKEPQNNNNDFEIIEDEPAFKVEDENKNM